MSNRQTLTIARSNDAEASVIGAILVRADVLDLLELRVEDFQDPRCALVFGALRALRAAGRPLDGVTVLDQLGVDKANAVGGLAYLGELIDRVPTADNVAHYAAIVADLALKRRVALLVEDIEATAVREVQTGEQLLAALRDKLARVATPQLVGVDIAPMSVRLSGERAARLAEAKRIIPFEVAYLDDLLGGMLPHDLVVLTARAGAGKTQLASTIAENAARAGRRPVMLALEAEPREIERRIKYRALARFWADGYARRRQHGEPIRTLSYGAWCRGEFDAELAEFEPPIERALIADLGDRLHTAYRRVQFTLEDVEKVMVSRAETTDLFILDHLHYVDTPDEERENEAVTQIMTKLRDLALRLGKPTLVVAHLRKEDAFRASLVPRLADLHGSSNVTKIATCVVALAPAPHPGDKATWHLQPTFMQVLKDRRDGAQPLVAKVVFDRQISSYRSFYELGVIKRGKTGEEWEAISHLPSWAKRAENEPQRSIPW